MSWGWFRNNEIQISQRVFLRLDSPRALFRFVEMYVLTLFEVLADGEEEEARFAQEDDSATLVLNMGIECTRI